jgi:hypothetical protein
MAGNSASPFSNIRPDATFVAQTQAFVKPPVPTAAQVAAAAVKTKTSQIASLQKDIQSLQDLSSIYNQAQYQMSLDQKYINNLKAAIPKGATPTASQTRDINDALAAYQTAAAAFTKQQGIIQTKQNQINSLKQEITKLTTKPKTTKKDATTTTTPPPNTAGDSGTLPYIYNAPMVNSAYLNPFGPQGSSVTDSKVIANPGTFTDARDAWKGVTPSKGVMQMSKIFASKAPAPSAANKKANVIDPNNYGFKFMYNPTNVSMAWGLVDQFSPEYVASGQSQMTAMAIGLMKSTISFSLLLNRIGDMNFLSSDGSVILPGDKMNTSLDSISDSLNTISSALGGTPNNLLPWNPYPHEVLQQERADIYKRGTMYDLEYLFKAMGGHYATYSSGLNGTTADRGWLQPIPLELHLGAGLRYLVRVSSLDVTHIQFNERMVPTLTTVNVSCTRYYDSPEAYNTDSTDVYSSGY